MNHSIYLIAAVDDKGGVGKNERLPWTLKKDLAFFQRTTIKTDNLARENMVVMGHKTWDSIPADHRPLPGRRNVVLTRQTDLKIPGVYTATSLPGALQWGQDDFVESIFVIGGGRVFEEAIRLKELKGIYLTHVKGQFNCDTFFPKIPRGFKAENLGGGEENGVRFEFVFYKK